jgi:hypothetical protein
MRAFLLLILAYSVAPSQPEVKYDRFEDRTTISTQAIKLSTDNQDFFLPILDIFRGKAIKKSSSLYLTLGMQWGNGDNSRLYVIVGKKKRMEFERVSGGESCIFQIPRKDLKEIFGPKDVECRIGKTEFTMPDYAKDEFKNFVAFIDSAPRH